MSLLALRFSKQESALLAKSLSHKHGHLTLVPDVHWEKIPGMVVCVCSLTAGEVEPGSCWARWLAGRPHRMAELQVSEREALFQKQRGEGAGGRKGTGKETLGWCLSDSGGYQPGTPLVH